jgi:hypothetical protein
MKPKIPFLVLSLLAASTFGHAADAPADKSGGRVEVSFDQPEKFRDVKDSAMGENESSSYLGLFRSYLQDTAPRYLADGQKLSVTFTDIDMAGEYEPWRGGGAMNTRFVKAIYIPRLKFDYRVTDASGAVVKEGQANLSDLNFQNNIGNVIDNSDPLRYEKRLLNDWLRSELGRPAKKK